jgi:crotonobetainyl-CoA:carnitine CoA-transferase CaiB-like acyl-CoA transferase
MVFVFRLRFATLNTNGVQTMLPLAGVRVLAVEQYGAGPFGTMFLADQGAEVIKIENPNDGGDMSRAVGPYFFSDGDSEFFHSFNRNKKSLTLDLKRRCARVESARRRAGEARAHL